jgi:uncharacterized protein (DUF169 family)
MSIFIARIFEITIYYKFILTCIKNQYMETEVKKLFIQRWKKYFNNPELPITFYYTDKPVRAEIIKPSEDWNCIICQLKKVRSGKSLAFNKESVSCGGGRRYLGFADKLRPEFEYFLSCGIENKMEGERYIRTPELVKELMKNQKKLDVPGKYIVFKRWDKLEEFDNPDVAVFFVTPDVLSGLFTLANYDQSEPNSTFTPFGSGCGSIIHYPYLEKDSSRPRAIIGMFDPSARVCVPSGALTFSVPMVKLIKMISYMDESFLTTGSWSKVQKRIS